MSEKKDIAKDTAFDNVIEMVPILPLRDVVVYPCMAVPLFVGREKSVKALSSSTSILGLFYCLIS